MIRCSKLCLEMINLDEIPDYHKASESTITTGDSETPGLFAGIVDEQLQRSKMYGNERVPPIPKEQLTKKSKRPRKKNLSKSTTERNLRTQQKNQNPWRY